MKIVKMKIVNVAKCEGCRILRTTLLVFETRLWKALQSLLLQ